MTIETAANPAKEWTYRHKDTCVVKIRQWSMPDLFNGGRRTCWAYYVSFTEKACAAEVFDPLYALTEDYYSEAFTPNQVDWHGGITYAENKAIGGIRIIECGCDYQHYADEGCTYTVAGIALEAERTADDLIALLHLKARK